MIADILSNKKRNPVVTELFITDRKLNISLVFLTHSYLPMPKIIRLNSTFQILLSKSKSTRATKNCI